MSTDDLIAGLRHRPVAMIDRDALRELIDAAKVLRQDDTGVAGWIRILGVGGAILVQEEAPLGEVLVRRVAARESAERFVDLRMRSYERMWDGCGCTIDYFGEWTDDASLLEPKPAGTARRR